ncbi:MAG TPA: FAD-dependent oxidoreductase [Phnomibacter sp.]|nr:FAD-dependent oxidoreductase [Phnomibacter sp.]
MKDLRQHNLDQLQESVFDICIIGGGATGAGAALDAAARGYKVLLIEKNDFGSGTSSKSTKLIHGGVRYLEQAFKKLSIGQYRMVSKALHERATLLKIAPHITRPLQLVTPCRTWIEGVYYFIGLKLYDFISGRSHIGKSELLSRQKALQKIPTLKTKGLFSAVVYYDGQLDDLRFNWALIQTAITKGAICINHTVLHAFQKTGAGKIVGATIVDALTGKQYSVNAKLFVNATGPFSDSVRLLANEMLLPRMQVSKGVHILLPKQMMPSSSALLIPKTKDGRLIFAIPYQKHLLVGTTDDPGVVSEKEFGPTAQEVQYLLEYVNEYLDVQATKADVLAGFGGLRPLVKKSGESTKDLVRDHEVEIDERSGLISILGGKWTTYRLMAKDTIDAAEKFLHSQSPCSTKSLVLIGSETFTHHTAIQLQQQSGWDHEVVKHLASTYGDQSLKIAAITLADANAKNRLLPGMPYTYAELHYVVEHEMAYTVKDAIAGRWGTPLASWQQAMQLIPVVGSYMTHYFNWGLEQQEKYIHQYQLELKTIIDGSNV